MPDNQLANVIAAVLSYGRDIVLIGCPIALTWKARGLVDKAVKFIDDVQAFMEGMTKHADVVVNNHLKHLEDSGTRIEKTLNEQSTLLTTIAGKKKNVKSHS